MTRADGVAGRGERGIGHKNGILALMDKNFFQSTNTPMSTRAQVGLF